MEEVAIEHCMKKAWQDICKTIPATIQLPTKMTDITVEDEIQMEQLLALHIAPCDYGSLSHYVAATQSFTDVI